jgi:DNA-binding beta-propeller fold protein YncE
MSAILGQGDFTYEALDRWEKLPGEAKLIECPGVAVDSQDRVFVLTRNPENPVIVFDRDGNWLKSFGQGVLTTVTHGIHIGPDDTVYCTSVDTHTVTKFSMDGEVLLTLGDWGEPSVKWSGEPFHRPTHAVVSTVTGNIYVSDGYGNARIHKYTPDGRLLRSWGEPGIDPGQFIWPHNMAIDAEERVYVADRECHRVQIFDAEGKYISMWNNIHRPDGITIGPDGNVYIGELNSWPMIDAPGLGHRVSVLSPKGKLLARFGDPDEGEEPGKFIAPHGIAVDSRGDVYVGEVSYTIRGSHMDPPRELKSLKKLRRLG